MGNPIQSDNIYTAGQAARILRVSHGSVGNWIRDGRLASFKLPGGANRIYGRELLRFMKEMGMGEPSAGDAARVLVVDDDDAARTAMAAMLAAHPEFEVRTAANGVQAGLIAKEFIPDLIVLDIKLGDMDGRELCTAFRADPELSDVRILGASGKITAAEGRHLLAEGFDAYLPKPFKGDVLAEAVMELLKKEARAG